MIIGLDVGGTHTDVVLIDRTGLRKYVKVPTEPTHLFNSILTGLNRITEGIQIGDIRRLVLSTTLTTNAVLQKKLPPVGLIVSAGPGIDPALFRIGPHYYTISGAIDHRGRETAPLTLEQIRRVSERMQAEGIENIAVVGKFATRNPKHELAIRDLLKDAFANIFMGHRVSGNLNFPRRIATTYLNAAVYPLHRDFFAAVKKSLDQQGIRAPIYILKADGGSMSFEASLWSPDQTILSGPAASVMGALAFAPQADSLVLDIGGTSTDMAVLVRQTPLLNPKGAEIDCYATLIRALETHSIGLGGDSAVSIEKGMLKIGPERFGPAMAYGGPVPTPTDALAVLGKISDGDTARAEQGIGALASQMDVSVNEMAERIFDSTCRRMLSAAREMIKRLNSKPVYTVHELLEGYRIEPAHILVLGGPAEHFAGRLEEISRFKVTVVPCCKVANAIGAALARTTCEVDFLADTEQRLATAAAEDFSASIPPAFSHKDALAKAFDLLKAKAIATGADTRDLELEVVEELSFNMVRGFNTIGKNMRIKVQVKPGLIHEYQNIAAGLQNMSDTGSQNG